MRVLLTLATVRARGEAGAATLAFRRPRTAKESTVYRASVATRHLIKIQGVHDTEDASTLPPTFRAEAVELARTSGKGIPQLAANLGIAEQALRGWVKRADSDAGRGPVGELTTDEREELRRLRRENQVLRQEREILRKAAAYFAQETLCAATGSSTRSGPTTPSRSSAGCCGCRGSATRSGRAADLVGCHRRRRARTTVAEPTHTPAPRLVARDSRAMAPDRLRIGDSPDIATAVGGRYLAVLGDVHARRVVGWALADQLRTERALDALALARQARRPSPGRVHHTDRGYRYTAATYQTALAARGLVRSMSRAGACLDNAMGAPLRHAQSRTDRHQDLADAQCGPTGHLRMV